eukprot:scaffold1870_cov73-Cyclotella_meneghiniana.AAC.4
MKYHVVFTRNMYRCMHFSDDWEVDENGVEAYWEDVAQDARYEPSPEVARHRKKYEHIEDGFNRRWKEIVNFGRWITADESRVAGWYKSGITIGPEPKPIRTGATIHSICVTHGDLATFKLQCRVYGGKHDEDLNVTHPSNTASTQKWVNLYNEMLHDFKDKGMCVTLDSAYSGDILFQIARDVWSINMVGTCQSDRSGGGALGKDEKKSMKIGSYESIMYQHRVKNLVYAMWADNSIVKTLSNFHSPEVLTAGTGVSRRRRVDGVREQDKTQVPCPEQQKDYSETFHLIDKGNGKESKYDMGGQSKGHNWAPKLCMRYFNFGLGNAHTMYAALVKQHTPDRRVQKMAECLCSLTHSLLQRGQPMRKRAAEHPNNVRDLTNVYDFGCGRKTRTDAKGDIAAVAPAGVAGAAAPAQRERQLRTKQKRHPWRVHQSTAGVNRGHYAWGSCPSLKTPGVKRPRSARTHMHCEECSAAKGRPVFLCNEIRKGEAARCHFMYHTKYHKKKYDD